MNSNLIPNARYGLATCISVAMLFVCTAAQTFAADNEIDVAVPSDVGLDASKLNEVTARIRSNPDINIHSVLVVKDNKLVFEEYFSGPDYSWGEDLGVITFDSDSLHDLRSVTKSITSALVGIAISEGKIADVNTSVFDLFPAYLNQMAPDKKSLTLQHILTMSAGLDWFEPIDYTNPGNDEIRMIGSPDPVAFTLGRSLTSEPGQSFLYNGGLPTLLGYLLENAYGKSGDQIAKEKLFDPLGIDSFEFHSNTSGMLAYASGLRLTARDMAKIGMLYVNNGMWRGEQIIPADWVEASLKPYLESSFTPGYGYQWWIMRFDSEDGSLWVPTAIGNGGQRIFIVQPYDMVVVVTAGNYNTGDVELWGSDVLMEYVFPSLGLPEMRFIPAGDN
jgi:CubicO group peptidase (beta-lactamase class C family)